MKHIRPYRFFGLIAAPPADRFITAAIPYRRGEGVVTLLEMFVIIAASKIVNARQAFEFGTFLGGTTMTLAANIPESGKVFTLDLDETIARSVKQDIADAPLTEIHLASRDNMDFAGSYVENKITRLTGNSTAFDFSPWYRSCDLVFIDGGHDYATVKSDSENAFRLLDPGKPSCILWHDYRNPRYDGLTHYLNELSHEKQLFHVEDTTVCVSFNDSASSLQAELLR